MIFNYGFAQTSILNESLMSEVYRDYNALFENFNSKEKVNVSAIIIPNPSSSFSGKDAIKVYGYLAGSSSKNIIFISSLSTEKSSSFILNKNYETPFGVIEINKDLSNKISRKFGAVKIKNSELIIPLLSKHLPFIQFILKEDISVTPVFINLNNISKNLIQNLFETYSNDENILILTEDIARTIKFNNNVKMISIDNTSSNWKVILRND